MKKALACTCYVMMMMNTNAQERKIYESNAYSIFTDRIVQGSYEAKALSATQMQSNYQSPANFFQSAEISFKFAINGRDNELPSGTDHHFTVVETDGSATTPLIVFGQQTKSVEKKALYLKPSTPLTLLVDMREILKQFANVGYYTTFKGDKIYKDDFKGVFVAGNTAPLIWDFDNLVNHPELQLKDPDGDGIYETTIILNAKQESKETAHEWRLKNDISSFPQYSSDYVITNALYNMALDEMQNAVEGDSTFRTGKEWAGVWTRDISYSIILSMAYLQPEVAKNSLLRKVNEKKRIIQDTGTGGAWPASTDRMIWAVAAYEIYKVTGDQDWLQQAYEIIKNSIEDDLKNVYDYQTGMVRGESSFLDWREQTYPRWMQPADIFESECLGTNAVHFQANTVLAQMAELLHHPEVAAKHKLVAENIKNGMNKYLWQAGRGYYGQYLYGRNYKLLSSKSEALGEALSVIFDIADMAQQTTIVDYTPITDYGIPCIYPQIPEIPPYHNNGIWPFVQSYWLWAAAKAGNERSVVESMAAIYRPAALFLTNKENFVADNGDFLGTQINSSNMLWSLSGNISMIHKVIFGIHFNTDNIQFMPFVPAKLAGQRTLKNFRYRNAVLDIDMQGYGNGIQAFYVDGKLGKAQISDTLTGHHQIKILLNNRLPQSQSINKVANYTAPPSPKVTYQTGKLSWQAVENASVYQVYNNGSMIKETSSTEFSTTKADADYASYQVVAVDKNKVPSFASEPIDVIPAGMEKRVEAETVATKAAFDYKGFSGNGFIEISNNINKEVSIEVEADSEGWYAIDYRYANGNGPTNTENKCAIRSLLVDNVAAGTIVLPQRGKGEWSNWGFTNSVQVLLKPGRHTITLKLEPYNDNMNGKINQAMLDYLRMVKLK